MLKGPHSRRDSRPLDALKLSICRSKQRIVMSGHEHKAGYWLEAFIGSRKARGEWQQAWCWSCQSRRQCFQMALKTKRSWRGFSLHWGASSQVEAAGSPGRGQGGEQAHRAGHRQGVLFASCFFALYLCLDQLLFTTHELLPTFVGIPGFLGNFCWPVPEENFRNTLIFLYLMAFSLCLRVAAC